MVPPPGLESIIDFLQRISQHIKNVQTSSTGVLAEERIWQQGRSKSFFRVVDLTIQGGIQIRPQQLFTQIESNSKWVKSGIFYPKQV